MELFFFFFSICLTRYDFRAGFWGIIGGPCLGIIPVRSTNSDKSISPSLMFFYFLPSRGSHDDWHFSCSHSLKSSIIPFQRIVLEEILGFL
jgi:hypothetical protein